MRSVSNRGVLIGTAALLVALWVLNTAPRSVRELLVLAGLLALAIFGGRGVWKWWRARSPAAGSVGLLASLGVAAGGWLVVGTEWSILRAVGDSYAMVIVAPLLIVFGLLAGLAGLAAAFIGIAVAARAATMPTERRALVVTGGALAFVLNLTYPWALLKLWG